MRITLDLDDDVAEIARRLVREPDVDDGQSRL